MTFSFKPTTTGDSFHCCGCAKNGDCGNNAARLAGLDDGRLKSDIVLCLTCWPHRDAIAQLLAAGALLPRGVA